MNILPGWFPGGAAAAAVEALNSITQVLSATSDGSETINAPSGIQAGDLILLLDRAAVFGSPPTAVTPAGFTNILNTSATSSGFVGVRQMLSYKLATGSEGSTSITGMADSDGKCLLVFRGNIPAVSITAADPEGQITDGDPTSQTVNASGGVAPLIVIGAYSSFDAVDPRTMSPAKDGEIAPDTFTYLAWKIYNSGPANVSVDMADEGSANGLQSCYIEMA